MRRFCGAIAAAAILAASAANAGGQATPTLRADRVSFFGGFR
jgi:hypothetical protein